MCLFEKRKNFGIKLYEYKKYCWYNVFCTCLRLNRLGGTVSYVSEAVLIYESMKHYTDMWLYFIIEINSCVSQDVEILGEVMGATLSTHEKANIGLRAAAS